MRGNGLLSCGLVKSSARRFWPLWLAYAVVLGLLFVAPAYMTVGSIVYEPSSLSDKVSEVKSLWVIARAEALCFAFAASLIAAVAYSDHLFSGRSATFMGSLPIRRERLFATSYVSGLLPLLAIPALAALCLLPLSATSAGVLSPRLVGQWLVLVAALTIVFYSFAQLACQLTGARAVAVLLYGVINFLVPCLELAVGQVVVVFVYGLADWDLRAEWLAPFVGIAAHGLTDGADMGVRWPVVAGYVAAALAVSTLAGWLFVRRRFEAAGESVVHAPVKTFLTYLAGVSMALLFATVYCLLRQTTGLNPRVSLATVEVLQLAAAMAVGGFLGVLFAQMIMARSARVLGRCWKAGLATSVAALLFVLGCSVDVLGIERRVPEPESVKTAALRIDWKEVPLTDADSIAALCELHRDIIDYGVPETARTTDESYRLDLCYRLVGGATLTRSYQVPASYEQYLRGVWTDDEGVQLVDRAVQIANSPAGRRARFQEMLDGDVHELEMTLEYFVEEDLEWQSVQLPLGEREDLVAGALRNELLNGVAGDIMSDLSAEIEDADQGSGFNTILSIYDKEGRYLGMVDLDEQDTPELVDWVRKHYPEALPKDPAPADRG